MTSHRFFKMASATWQFYFRFRFWWLRSIRKVKIYLRAKFRWHFSIHCWDSTTSGFLKQTSAMLNSTSGFDFHVCITIGMSFWFCLPNFVIVLWRHIHFSRWRQRHRNATSGFVFRDCLFGKVEIYLQTNFLYYYRFLKTNGRHACWNSSSGFDFHVCVTIGMSL